MTKHIILVAGIWGVGKSHYCDNFIKRHLDYVLVDADTDIDEYIKKIRNIDYVIGDYYFFKDWNAEKLRKSLNCAVDIYIIFDSPEDIVYRQIFKKENISNVSCSASDNLYLKNFRELVYLPKCTFIDSGNEESLSYSEFNKIKYDIFLTSFTEVVLKDFLKTIEKIEGFDKHYQEIDLPYGLKMGKKGYSYNKESWNIIKDLIEWKYKKVLDVGCNIGYNCQEIWLRGGYPIGIDRHHYALYTASIFSKVKGMDFPLYKIDIDKKQLDAIKNIDFDIALCLNIFHHLKFKDYVLQYLSKIPIVIFEINKDDVDTIKDYFDIVKKLESPKYNRYILLCKGVSK